MPSGAHASSLRIRCASSARRFALGLLGIVAPAAGLSAQLASGQVVHHQKLSALEGSLPAGIAVAHAGLGNGSALLGDIDADGRIEVAVGTPQSVGGTTGSVWILSLETDGTAASAVQIGENIGGFTGDLDLGDDFGFALAAIGDLDGNGVVDLAVGALGDDGEFDLYEDAGAVWILFLDADGHVLQHVKWGAQLGGDPFDLSDGDNFGASVAALGDLDGDGVTELAVGSWYDSTAGPGVGAITIFFMEPDGSIKATSRITEGTQGFVGPLDTEDHFAMASALGDFDGDGIPDLAVGAPFDDDGGPYNQFLGAGAVWLLMLTADGAVKSQAKISDTAGTLMSPLQFNDRWGYSIASLGDLDGDGVIDLAVGSQYDGFISPSAGAVWILFLRPDGTVKSHSKIGWMLGGFTGALSSMDGFGFHISALGDLDGDGVIDLLAGAPGDDDGGMNVGAEWVLFLRDGVVPWAYTGDGLAGTAGVPELWGEGTLRSGPNALHLADAKASTPAFLVVGASELNAQFKGGVLVPNPVLILPFATNAAGEVHLPFVMPTVPEGVALLFQFWIQDSSAVAGYAASNGLEGLTP